MVWFVHWLRLTMSGTSLSPSSSAKKRHFFQPPIKLTTNASSPSKRVARRASSSRDASVATLNADDELTSKRKASTLRVLSIWDSLEKRYARPLEQDDIVDLETMRIVHDRGALRSMPQRTFGTVHKPEHTNGAESSGGEDEDEEQDPDDDEDELGRWEVDDFEEVIRLRPQPKQLTVHDKNDLEEFLYADEQRQAALGDPDEDLRQSSVESQSSFRPTPSVEQEQDEEEDGGSATDDLDGVLPRKRVQFKSLSATPGARGHECHNDEDEQEEEEEEYVHSRRRAVVEDDGSSSDDPLAVARADDVPRYPSSEPETLSLHPRNVSRARSSSPKKLSPKRPTPARPKVNPQLFTPSVSKSPGRPEAAFESVSRRPEEDTRFWSGPYDSRTPGPSRLPERDRIREWTEDSIPFPLQPSPRKRKRGPSPLPTPTPDSSYTLSSRGRSTPYHVDRQGSPQRGHTKRPRYLEYEYDRLPLHDELHGDHHVPSPSSRCVPYRPHRDEPLSPPRDIRDSRAPSSAPTVTPHQFSELMFHLKKVSEWARHRGLEDDLYPAVAEEEALIPRPLFRDSTPLRQQRSHPELRGFVREESVAEAPGKYVTPRRPRVSSGGLYEPSSSSSRYSDRMLPPDTPSAWGGDSPVNASSWREQMATPSTFKRVVQVCVHYKGNLIMTDFPCSI